MRDRRAVSKARIAKCTLIAQEAGLSCPLGRAVYLENRIQNAGGGSLMHHLNLDPEAEGYKETLVKALTRVKLETARRWLRHYRAGGSIRCLTRTWEEQAAFVKKQRDRIRKPFVERLDGRGVWGGAGNP